MTARQPRLTLNDGHTAPQLGFGVWQIDDNVATEAVASAIKAGYRSVDTAAIYGNEKGTGEGLRRGGVPREEIFLTTKLWNADQGFDSTLRAFDKSLKLLGTDYVDMYLIHWPMPAKGTYVDTFRAMIRLRDEGRIRSVGVSNFNPAHVDHLIAETGVAPVVNQIELHPDFQQNDVVKHNRAKNVVTESWSPLGQGGDLLKNPTLSQIAGAHGKSVAQVILRWHLQTGHMVIPKSQTPARIEENFDVFDFLLSTADMQKIAGLDAGHRIGPNPDSLN
ncbi:aldo/keto reductase [Pinirhizobacter sp.]|uniref:aldo/keto reductase n=1 Tax=Pinirhizobacter sp. TaxID=2950432 RepID=UPI002F3FBCB7